MAEISTSGYKDYVAGLLAGVAAVAVGHPFDTVKVQFSYYLLFDVIVLISLVAIMLGF